LHDLRFVNIAYMHPDLRLRVIPFVDYQMSYFRPSNTFQPNPLGGSYIDFYSSAYSTALNAYKTPSRPPRKRGKRKRGKGGKRVQFTNPNPTPYPFLTLYVVASSPLSKNLGRRPCEVRCFRSRILVDVAPVWVFKNTKGISKDNQNYCSRNGE
jgi:hypothetical protein